MGGGTYSKRKNLLNADQKALFGRLIDNLARITSVNQVVIVSGISFLLTLTGTAGTNSR